MLALLADPQNWLAFITLSVLEIVLGFDNIIFISILVGRLPAARQEAARITGLALALLLRFEFMNPGFTKVVAGLTTVSMGVIVYVFLSEVFGGGQAPF